MRMTSNHTPSDGHDHGDHHNHHTHMVADSRRRFWISLVLTIPVLALAPLIQAFLEDAAPNPERRRSGRVGTQPRVP